MPASKMEAPEINFGQTCVMVGPVHESVPCNMCGSDDLETIYEARADLERDPRLTDKFRASSDELLTQPLVRCRRCSLLFVNPRFATGAMLDGYAAGGRS